MISFLVGLLIGTGWSWHDSFYTKIRKESIKADRDMGAIYNWSLWAKGIKAVLFITAGLCYFYATWHVVLAFGLYWVFGFDQVHAKFAWGKFMSLGVYADRHILHRVWQQLQMRFK